MECQHCGFLMDPLDDQCPRCKQMGLVKVTSLAPSGVQNPLPSPSAPPVAAPAGVRSAPSAIIAPAPARAARPVIVDVAPPLGWACTISLLCIIGVNGLLVLLISLSALIVQAVGGSEQVTSMAGPAMIALWVAPAVRIAAAIGLLNQKGWGFWTLVFGSFISVVKLMSGFDAFDVTFTIIPAIPAAVSLILLLPQLREME